MTMRSFFKQKKFCLLQFLFLLNNFQFVRCLPYWNYNVTKLDCVLDIRSTQFKKTTLTHLKSKIHQTEHEEHFALQKKPFFIFNQNIDNRYFLRVEKNSNGFLVTIKPCTEKCLFVCENYQHPIKTRKYSDLPTLFYTNQFCNADKKALFLNNAGLIIIVEIRGSVILLFTSKDTFDLNFFQKTLALFVEKIKENSGHTRVSKIKLTFLTTTKNGANTSFLQETLHPLINKDERSASDDESEIDLFEEVSQQSSEDEQINLTAIPLTNNNETFFELNQVDEELCNDEQDHIAIPRASETAFSIFEAFHREHTTCFYDENSSATSATYDFFSDVATPRLTSVHSQQRQEGLSLHDEINTSQTNPSNIFYDYCTDSEETSDNSVATPRLTSRSIQQAPEFNNYSFYEKPTAPRTPLTNITNRKKRSTRTASSSIQNSPEKKVTRKS